MSKFKIEISADVEFDSVEQAYFMAQMLEIKFLNSCDAENIKWDVTELE